MLPLPLSRGISSGCHHATLHQNFFDLSLLCEGDSYSQGALCFCIDLSWVFPLDATMPPLPLQPKNVFLELSILWEGALCFSFDLARVFLQGANMSPYTRIFSIFHNCVKEIDIARGFMFLLLLIWGIYSGCHHANPTAQKFFWLCQ